MHEIDRDNEVTPAGRIRVLGLGSAGCCIVDRLWDRFKGGPPAAVVHTNAATLGNSGAPVRLQIGKARTGGAGSGGDPSVGRNAAQEDARLISGLLENTDILFLITGLGGGTGTGAAPVIAQMASDAGIVTLCLATLPFSFEGTERMRCAEEGLRELLKTSELVLVLPNSRLLEEGDDQVSLKESFERVDEAVSVGISAIRQLVSQQGMINIGFADIKSVGRGSGGACTFGYGRGEGADRASEAVEAALASPMLGRSALSKSEALMVGIVGDSSLALKEIDEIMGTVHKRAARGAHIFMGAVADENADGRLLVALVASEHWKDRETRGRSAKGRRRRQTPQGGDPENLSATQVDLGLVTVGRGRFKDVEPTMLDGEDLDIPTFIRHGISIDR